MANLSLKSINKIYPNNVQAVFDFNMEIKDKEFVVFVGPSGCGKSTTLRMIAGLETITSGELYIDGLLVNNVEPKDRSIAMVFQSYALYPHMTTYKNIQFALKLRKLPMTLYKDDDKILPLLDKEKQLYKAIKANDKAFRKNQNDDSLVEKHLQLYQELYDLEDQIKQMKEPVRGKDELGIVLTEKHIKKLNLELNKNEKILSEAKICLETLLKKEKPSNEKKLKSLEKDIQTMKNAVMIYESAVEQNKSQIVKANERLKFLNNNDVDLYKIRKLTRQEIDIEVNKAAECLDLTKYLFRKPGALSGGQRQRVALGRCIVRKPKVFLMDEPLSNLDAKLRVQTRGEILNIHKRVGATTIYVTHDQTEAMTMADRIVVMKSGVIQQIGTPSEVYSNPQNKFVASFIGSPAMNFLSGKYTKGEFILNGDKKIKIDVKEYSSILKSYENKEVLLGIRPESISILKSSGEGLKVNYKSFELLGYDVLIYTELNGQNIVIRTSSEKEFKEPKDLLINLDKKKLYFFDKDNGNRIK